MRVTFLAVMPSPYMVDLFDAMAADGRIEPRVLYLEEAAPDTYWAQRELPTYSRVLPGKWYWCAGARLHWNAGVVSAVREDPGDVTVVVGYGGFSQQRVLRWLAGGQQPWVFLGEAPGFERRGRAGTWVRELAQQPVQRADGIVAIGSRAEAAYRAMTGGRVPVANIPYVCELGEFQAARGSGIAGSAPGGAVRFLYCGQMIQRKGVDVLLEAFYGLAERHRGATLTLVGEGPQRREWEQRVPAELRGRVEFTGFRQVHELPADFGAADVFVLPSRHDGWGVVVNQALGAGLAVIASDGVGAARDLVEEGRNGFAVPAGDATALRGAMARFVESPGLAMEFGRRSAELAQDVTPAAGVERWVEFLTSVLRRRGSPELCEAAAV